ncbi:MAG: hypothetical protein U0414_27865 [Polyangiaceae bacterium]
MGSLRAILAVASVFALAGCLKVNPTGGSSGDGDGADDPPDVEGSLGAFDVVATLKQTSCGVGALGMANQWDFVVGLGRDGAAATWDVGGGPIAGVADGTGVELSFDARLVIDMRKEGDGGSNDLPACKIERHDVATAILDDAKDPRAFQGTISYTFTPTTGSNCADLFVGSTAQFAELPCTALYGVTGKKRAD